MKKKGSKKHRSKGDRKSPVKKPIDVSPETGNKARFNQLLNDAIAPPTKK